MAEDEPGIIEKINFIVKFAMDPCDAPWTAYALAASGAALEAFVSLYEIDWSDIFWSAFAASTGINRQRSGRKGRRGKKGRRGFDVNENIGKQIGQWGKMKATKYPLAVGGLWVGFGILNRLNYWLFFADVVVQFLYRWTSLMFESRYCQAQKDAVILRKGAGYRLPALFPKTLILVPTLEKIRGPLVSRGGWVTIPEGYSGVIIVALKYRPTTEVRQNILTLEIKERGRPTFIKQEKIYGLYPEWKEAALHAEIVKGGTYQVMVKVDRGFGSLKEIVFYGQFSGPPADQSSLTLP